MSCKRLEGGSLVGFHLLYRPGRDKTLKRGICDIVAICVILQVLS